MMNTKATLAVLALSVSFYASAEQRFKWEVEGYAFSGTKQEIIDEAQGVINKYRFFIDDSLINTIDLNKNESISKNELSEFFDMKLSQNNNK